MFAYVTAGHIKFLLLHEGRNEDAVRNFFLEVRRPRRDDDAPALAHKTRAQVHEQYVKLMMNPFYTYDTPITSESFDKKIHALARRHL